MASEETGGVRLLQGTLDLIVLRALDTMGPHMLAGMLTTAVGFCASCVMLLPMSTSFGLLTGAAIALVYLATLFALPALLVGAAPDAPGE